MLAALCFYADFGGNYDQQKMIQKLPEYIPKTVYREETVPQWEKLIASAFTKCRCKRENLPKLAAMEDVVYFAKITWSLKFSRFFEVLKVENDADTQQSVLIFALNSSGIFLVDSQEQVLVRILD